MNTDSLKDVLTRNINTRMDRLVAALDLATQTVTDCVTALRKSGALSHCSN